MNLPRYPRINSQATGRRLHFLCCASGFTVHDLQEYCHLSGPESVYKWFAGTTLPNLDNFYALSTLLGMSLNDIIVSDDVAFLWPFAI